MSVNSKLELECCNYATRNVSLLVFDKSADSNGLLQSPAYSSSPNVSSKNVKQPKLFTKCLRKTIVCMWSSALQEKLNFCFSGDFY